MTTETPLRHTPGPWVIRTDASFGPEGPPHLAILAADEVAKKALAICVVSPMSCVSTRDIANACLMAAAPELLSALKAVLRVADRQTTEFDAARAAIRLAETGERA